jgi:hypothetical protein
MQPHDLNDNLALLSLRVAEAVDHRLMDKQFDTTVFRDLGKELSRASGIGETETAAFLHSDPVTTEIFAQAVGEANEAAGKSQEEPVSDLNALKVAMAKIIEPLNTESLSENDLAAVKVFCLALHRSMMAQKLPPIFESENVLEDELRFI